MSSSSSSSSSLRDWRHLPELALLDILCRLLPSLPSLFAFAAVCRPWRRLLLATASRFLLPSLPPLLLLPPIPTSPSTFRLHPFSSLVSHPFPSHLSISLSNSTLLAFSRGHLLLLRRRDLLLLADALTGAEHRLPPLPSPHFPYHYAALTPSHLLLFFSKHSFLSLPLPNPNPKSTWSSHRLPRRGSYIVRVVTFQSRVLGMTDRAQLLEFHLNWKCSERTVQMLATSGLPEATAFERWHFGPQLVVAGERLLLVLFMLEPQLHMIQAPRRIRKISVYGLDMGEMRWEEVESLGEYSLFVDCAGRSAVACAGAESWGGESNRVYVAAPGCTPWKGYPLGGEMIAGAEGAAPFHVNVMFRSPWPSQIWVHPSLLF